MHKLHIVLYNIIMDKEDKDMMVQTMSDCKILYCMAKKPCTETCMCWNWECGQGWHQKLHEMSCKLELLNIMLYPEYKTRIQMDQVKEKFGTLRAYYSVVCDNYSIVGKLGNAVLELASKMRSINYGYKTVTDRESYCTHETEELTDEQYENYKKWNSTQSKLREENGKHYRDYELWHPAKCHVEVCKHKLLHKLMDKLQWLGRKLRSAGFKDLTSAQRIMVTYLDGAASKIIDNAEAECYKTCECCGREIGTDWSPRCETAGWITYICDECAAKKPGFYYKNGEKWQGGKMLMSKEEVDAVRKKFKEEMKKKHGECEDEDKE